MLSRDEHERFDELMRELRADDQLRRRAVRWQWVRLSCGAGICVACLLYVTTLVAGPSGITLFSAVAASWLAYVLHKHPDSP